VTGVSGSGKSSLVKAGLIAKIEKENNLSQSDPSNNYELWKICEPIRPSESPFKALVDAVEAPGEYENKKILDLSEKFYEKLEQYSRTQKSFLIAGQSSQNKKNLEEVEDAFNSLTKELSHQVSNEQNFLLVIDQFEELVTLCQPLEQEYFLKLLVQILKESQALRLVLTVRSDFEIYFRGSSTTSDSESSTTGSDISQYWNKEARLLVDEMSIDELRQAIEKPARLFGVDFESEQLVNDIIDDVRGMPGALALLSFTLEKLYQMAKDQMAKGSSSQNNREPITITRAHYQELGGVVKALTNKATEVYDKLGQKIEEENKGEFTQKYIKEFGKTPAEDESAGEVRQAMMKQLILRMVTTQGGKLAKRPVPISELQYPDWRSRYKNATYHMCQVIDQLIKERLIVSNSYESNKGNNNEEICYVEPAHDALILYWDKLHKKDETEQQQEQNNLVQKQDGLKKRGYFSSKRSPYCCNQDWHKMEEERNKTPSQYLENL
jgi:hypothetical protein